MSETGGASIEDLSISQKETQSFKNSYEFDSPASSIMENIFPEVEAYNGGELSSNLFSLEVNQTPDTKKWTLKINPAKKGTNSSEPSLIELDFSGQEGTQLKTNNNPEALLALQDLKTELNEVEDSFGALRTLVGRKAQDLIESKMTPEEHAELLKLKEARARAIQHQEEVLKANTLGGPTEASPELTAALEGHDRLKEQPQELDKADTTSTESDKPSIKTAAEREQYLEGNKDQTIKDLQEIRQAIVELTHDLKAKGMGETFIQNIANRLSGLGPDSEKTLALIKNGIPDLTSDEAIKAGLQVTTPEGIKANPKLAAELVDYQQKLTSLAENLPKNTLDEYFPGFFDHIYPDGLPEPEVAPANPNFIPSLGGDSAMEAGMEDEEYGEESNKSTIDDNSEQLPITETPKSNFARWIDDPERKISSSEFAEKYQEKIAQTEALVLEIQAEFKESHPDEYEKIFGETDSNPYDILQERIREQGKYSQGENREDVLAKFISEKLASQNISSPEFLMTSEYLSRQHEYTKLVEAAKAAESGNEQAFKRRVSRIQKKYGNDDARRAVSSAVGGGELGNPLFIHEDLSKEMSMTAEETRLNGYQDLRALQIVKDRVLDTWDPEARDRWAKYEADGSIVTLENESKQLDKVLTNILTKKSDKLTSKEKEILGVIDTLQKESVDEALSKFTGLTPIDGETTLKSIARWREEKGVEPYTQGELKQLTLKGLNLRERRSSPRTTQEITPVPPQPDFDLYYQVFQEKSTTEPTPPKPPRPPNPTPPEPPRPPKPPRPPNPTPPEPPRPPEPVEPLSEFQATVTAAKGQLETEVESVDWRGKEIKKKLSVRELLEAKAAEFARKMMSETRRKWDPEQLKNRPWYERWGQRASTLGERVWRGMLVEQPHFIKEKRHALNLMSAAGVESDFDFHIFEQVDQLARTAISEERDTRGKRIIGGLKDFGNEFIARERDLHRKRVEIVQNLRQNLEENPLDITNPLHPLVMRDYQRRTELANRISETAYNETLHTAMGEKRTEGAILLEKDSAPRKFISQEILKPIIKDALASGNTGINEGLKLELDSKLNDYWLSEEFQNWKKTLSPEDQEKLDLSLSYASNIISVAEEVLVPNVPAAKEHYEKMEEFDFDIKLTLGTARFGPNGEIPKQNWGEKRIALNEELFNKLGKEKRIAFGDELMGQGIKRAKYLALANDLVKTEFWALPAWAATKALTSTARLGAQAMSTPAGAATHVFAPMLAASGVAGIMGGIKRYASLTTDRAELNITEALGETRPEDALRAAEMKITDYHRVAFSDRIPELQALLEKETLDKGEIYSLLALTVDSDARSDIGARRNINLWRHEITDNNSSSFQAEEGTLDVLRSQAKLKLHTALLSESTGAVITSELGFPVEATSQDIISELTRVQTEYLERGSTVKAEYLTTLQAISPAEYKAVVAQDQAFRKFQMGQAVKQGAIVFGTSFVVQVGVRAASQFVKGEHFMGGAKVAPTTEADANNQNVSPAEKHGGYDPQRPSETILDSSHSPELDRSLPDGIGQVIDPETGKVIVTMNAYVPPGTHLVPQPGMPNTYDLISEKGGNTLIDNLQINPDGTPIINDHIQQQMIANGLSIRTIDLPPVEISQGGNGGYVDVRAGDLGPEGWWGMIRNKMHELNGHYPSDAETNAVKNMVRGYELWVNNPEDAGKDIFEIRPEPKYANVFQQQIIHSKPSIWGSEPAIAAQSENMWFNHIPKVLVEAENQEKLAALVREAIEQKEVQGLELDELHSLAYRIGRIAGEKMGIPNKDEVLILLDYMQGDTTTEFNPHDILINLKEDLVVDPLPPPLPPTPPHIPTDGVDIPFFFGYRRPLEAPERRNDSSTPEPPESPESPESEQEVTNPSDLPPIAPPVVADPDNPNTSEPPKPPESPESEPEVTNPSNLPPITQPVVSDPANPDTPEPPKPPESPESEPEVTNPSDLPPITQPVVSDPDSPENPEPPESPDENPPSKPGWKLPKDVLDVDLDKKDTNQTPKIEKIELAEIEYAEFASQKLEAIAKFVKSLNPTEIKSIIKAAEGNSQMQALFRATGIGLLTIPSEYNRMLSSIDSQIEGGQRKIIELDKEKTTAESRRDISIFDPKFKGHIEWDQLGNDARTGKLIFTNKEGKEISQQVSFSEQGLPSEDTRKFLEKNGFSDEINGHAHIVNPLPGEHINKSEEEIQAIENKKQYIREEIIPKLTELKPKITSYQTRVKEATDKVWEAFFKSTIGDLRSELTPEKYPLAYSFLREGGIDALQVTSVEDMLVGIGIFANNQMLDNFDPTIASKIKELQSEIPLSAYSLLQRDKNSIETIKSINFATKYLHQRRIFENELVEISNSDLSSTEKADRIKEINSKIINSEKVMYFQDKYPELEQVESFLNSLSNSENTPLTNPIEVTPPTRTAPTPPTPVSSPSPIPTPPVDQETRDDEAKHEETTPIETQPELKTELDSGLDQEPIIIEPEKPEINNIDSQESRLLMSRGKTEIHKFTNQEKIYHQHEEILLNGKKYLVDSASRVGEKRKVDEDFSMTADGIWKSKNGEKSINWQGSFVFDGAGGHAGGELASQKAAEVFKRVLSEVKLGESGNFLLHNQEVDGVEGLVSLLREESQRSLIAVKEELEKESQLKANPTTTMAGVLTIGDKNYVMHIGDSRVYKRTTDGKLIQITTDHSLVQELMNMGQQTPSEAKKNKLRSTLSRALSAESRGEITLNEVKLGEGEGFVVMCDGIPDAYDEEYLEKGVTPKKMARVISVAIAAKENAALSLLTRNTERASDNMSALVIYPKI